MVQDMFQALYVHVFVRTASALYTEGGILICDVLSNIRTATVLYPNRRKTLLQCP